jgi:hypothetical protein
MDEAGEAGALARRRLLQHLQVTVRVAERKKIGRRPMKRFDSEVILASRGRAGM